MDTSPLRHGYIFFVSMSCMNDHYIVILQIGHELKEKKMKGKEGKEAAKVSKRPKKVQRFHM